VPQQRTDAPQIDSQRVQSRFQRRSAAQALFLELLYQRDGPRQFRRAAIERRCVRTLQ
jgi:hypothetical protein